VLFFLSAPNAAKTALLQSAVLLLYTPSNEHFGIVPLEAMRAGTPVLAADNGGPTETVVDGETGFLRDPEDVDAWTAVIDKVLNKMSDAQLKEMGQAGKRRVREKFAEDTMAERLDGIFDQLVERHKAKNGDGESEPIDWPLMLFAIGFVVVSTVFMVGIQLW
jgi:alpha-1,3/alpha-1,6-mannosyltransferase